MAYNPEFQNPDGTFKKGAPSPNKNGRPRGSSNAVSKKRYDTMLRTHGDNAIEMVAKIALEMYQKGELKESLKAYFWLGDKRWSMIVHEDKLTIEEDKPKASSKEETPQDNRPKVIFTTDFKKNAEG